MTLELQQLANAGETAAMDWRALIGHTLRVEATMKLEEVHGLFKRQPVDYLPVTNDERYVGMVSRAQIGTILGARFGFALYAQHPVREHLLPDALAIVVDAPLLTALEQALNRNTATFHDDVALVDRDQRLLGMIPVHTLAQLQSQLLAAKLDQVERQQAALVQSNAELQRSNRELQDFAYIASHDLQEPLRKIQAFADRLASRYAGQLDEGAQDYLTRMQSAAKRLQSLINDLLQFSRVTTKARTFEPVDLATLAGEVVADLEVRLQQSGGRVELDALPVVQADPVQMRQLFQNLIGNALKFHKPGSPPVVRVSSRSDNGTVELVFADNGIGFTDEHGGKIFGMFQRLHSREEYEGNGVGLAICRKIAERHGGSITAQGVPNQGATFVVRLANATSGEPR
jgi:signal transduction histidine kinase